MTEPGTVWRPHVTVAAIAERNGQFLMVRELIDGVEKINQPAGHLEPGESIEQAVVRETLEETGYEFFPDRLCGVYRYLPDPARHHTYLRFAIGGAAGQRMRQQLDVVSIRLERLDEGEALMLWVALPLDHIEEIEEIDDADEDDDPFFP